MKRQIPFGFKCISETDYQIKIDLVAKGSLMDTIYRLSRLKYVKQAGKDAPKRIESITKFSIPPEFLKLIKVSLKRPLRDVEVQVKEDGIDLLSMVVYSANFVKSAEGDWLIGIVVTGQYVDKR